MIKDKHIEINELISKYHKEWTLDENLVSDKYHTFWDLYNHRYHLFIALCKVILCTGYENEKNVGWLAQYTDGNYKCLKSKKHFDWLDVWNEWGMFIIQLETMNWQISYHLPTEYWDICDFIPTLSQANEWDWHTPDDVLERLLLI